MIDPATFIDSLDTFVDFYSGVPDSLLKEFCACLDHTKTQQQHILAANEGNAIGLAAGHFLGTGKPALVYMQNSGIGNAVNPLISLMDEAVYQIPVLLLIGWRGEPGISDEPQHKKQGELTIPLLECMKIPYRIIDAESDPNALLVEARQHLEKNQIFALVARKNTFKSYNNYEKRPNISDFSREDALRTIVQHTSANDYFVATTGHISRELFEIRENNEQTHAQDFLTVGSMGHTSQIALGIALTDPNKHIFCLDGDGAALMHLGGLGIIGNSPATNLTHIVLNNAAHDSVGGQPTVAGNIDLCAIAQASGYPLCIFCNDENGLKNALKAAIDQKLLTFIEIRVKKGARKDLGRPTISPIDCKNEFRAAINKK